MTSRQTLRPWLVRAFQLSVAIGLLVVVWRFADGAAALELLSQAQLGWMFAALVALNAQVFLSARRWHITAGALGITVSYGTAVREYYLSQLVNQALPGGVVGDASRAVRARNQRGLLASGQSVIFERLSGQIALFGVMAIAITVTMVLPIGVNWPAGAIPLFVAGITLVAATALAMWLMVRTVSTRSAQVLRSWGRAAASALLSRGVVGQQVTLSLATALANIAGFVFCAWALGVEIGPLVALAVVPLILLTMLIPVTISGWGLREAAAAAVFPLAGFVASEGLATSVAFGLVLLITALPGLFMARSATAAR